MRKRGWIDLADLSISLRNQWVSGDTERIGRTGWSRTYPLSIQISLDEVHITSSDVSY